MSDAPDAAMMVPVEKIARFIATGDEACLSAFAGSGVVILENFAPFLFTGPDAVAHWAKEMRGHAKSLAGLHHTFGPAQDFRVENEHVYFSLPTHWSGHSKGRLFHEDGGWAFLLVKQRGEWRVQSYGWAVIRLAFG
jgi:hypothetical protein